MIDTHAPLVRSETREQRRSPVSADYHRLPIAEKRTLDLARAREPEVRCPACSVATTVRDLLSHVRERCTGRPEPHPLERWVTWAEARALGFSKASLCRASQAGVVRTRGPRKHREFLLRDIVLELARSRLAQSPTP